MPRRAPLALLFAGVALAGVLAPPARADEGPAAPPASARDAVSDPVAEALSDALSPHLAVRERATARLTSLVADPASDARDRVVAAFRTAKEGSREPLARVLAADGTRTAIAALLDALPRSREPGDAAAIRGALVANAEAVEQGVKAWRDAKGGVPPAIRDLERLLLRARLEERFLSRKSRSGTTGYYRGQYDVLLPDRTDALDLVLGILEDREPRRLRRPSEVPTGVFRFLRTPRVHVSKLEVQAMAANAVAELLRPTDVVEARRLHGYVVRLGPELIGLRERAIPGPEDDLFDTVLAALYRLRDELPAGTGEEGDLPLEPSDWYAERAEDRLRELSRLFRGPDSAAILALRMGRYGDALEHYGRVVKAGMSVALAYYNMACVLANWSLEDGLEPEERTEKRRLAAMFLERSVASGYVDWPWMEQDRDLDPIRDDPVYRRILERLKAEFLAPVDVPFGRTPEKWRPPERPPAPEPRPGSPPPAPVPSPEGMPPYPPAPPAMDGGAR